MPDSFFQILESGIPSEWINTNSQFYWTKFTNLWLLLNKWIILLKFFFERLLTFIRQARMRHSKFTLKSIYGSVIFYKWQMESFSFKLWSYFERYDNIVFCIHWNVHFSIVHHLNSKFIIVVRCMCFNTFTKEISQIVQYILFTDTYIMFVCTC